MKITKVDVYLLDAGTQRASRRPVVCRIQTDEGIYGDGEAGIAYGVGSLAAFSMVQDLCRLIIGKDPFQVEAIWEQLFRNSFWLQGGGAIEFAGLSAIDIALMDIKGKALGVPVYELIGGKHQDKLRCYASQLQFGWTSEMGPYGKKEDYVRIVKHAMSEGYDAVKIDFTMFDRDAKSIHTSRCTGLIDRDFFDMIEERLVAIREQCGNIDIIVENHCRTDINAALRIGELCDKYEIYAYEESVTPLNIGLHKTLRQKLRTPLADGERIYSRWGYVNFFKDNSIQLIQPDACNCGGITETKKVCDMAHAFDIVVQVHVAGGPISTAASLQIEAAIPNFCIHEHHFRSTQKDIAVLGKYDYQPENGYYAVPDLPGIGQEISEYAIKTALQKTTVE